MNLVVLKTEESINFSDNPKNVPTDKESEDSESIGVNKFEETLPEDENNGEMTLGIANNSNKRVNEFLGSSDSKIGMPTLYNSEVKVFENTLEKNR
jgi:hypothetical protein